MGSKNRRPRAAAARWVGPVALAFCLAASVASAEVLYYTDGDGVLHFTNVAVPGYARFETEAPLATLSDPLRRGLPGRRFRHDLYDDLIAEYSDVYGVEAALVKAVIRAESGFNRMARSPKGARGLMQLMPGTARDHDVVNVWDPSDNIRGGVKHLRMLFDRYGQNLPWVLAAYNAGAEAVERYRGIPPYAETRDYVSKVLRFRRDYLRDQRLASN